MSSAGYSFMPLERIRRLEPEMRRQGVSEVARSARGFLTAYKRAGGRAANLTDKWKSKRRGFIARHMAQYARNPTERRRLALNAWAYSPPKSH